MAELLHQIKKSLHKSKDKNLGKFGYTITLTIYFRWTQRLLVE